MYAPSPAEAVSISDPNLAMMVLLLGIFFIIVGLIIAGVVYREAREWRRIIMPLFDRVPAEAAPESAGEPGRTAPERTEEPGGTALESPEEPGGMTPEQAALRKELFGRFFAHMDVAGLLCGGATVVMGILVVLIGVTLNS